MRKNENSGEFSRNREDIGDFFRKMLDMAWVPVYYMQADMVNMSVQTLTNTERIMNFKEKTTWVHMLQPRIQSKGNGF